MKSTPTEKAFLKRWNDLLNDFFVANSPRINKKQIASLIGAYPDKIHVWKKGTYLPTLQNVLTGIENLKINPHYLFLGRLPKFLPSQTAKNDLTSSADLENQEAIQMLNHIKNVLLKQAKKQKV